MKCYRWHSNSYMMTHCRRMLILTIKYNDIPILIRHRLKGVGITTYWSITDRALSGCLWAVRFSWHVRDSDWDRTNVFNKICQYADALYQTHTFSMFIVRPLLRPFLVADADVTLRHKIRGATCEKCWNRFKIIVHKWSVMWKGTLTLHHFKRYLWLITTDIFPGYQWIFRKADSYSKLNQAIMLLQHCNSMQS